MILQKKNNAGLYLIKLTLKIPFFFLFSGLIIFNSCNSDAAQKKENKKNQVESTLIEQDEVLLLCKSVNTSKEETDAPAYEVFLQLAESKVKVADILNCETITPDQYTQYQIPENAISAAGGWWAGAGDYLYIVEESGNYVVKKGEMYEEKEDNNYEYQTIVSYNKNGELVD